MIVIFGSLNIDLVARVPVIPGPGRTVLAPSYETHFGGKGANQAVAAARLAGPGNVRMAGRVGHDGFGEDAIGNLAANGVETGLIVRGSEPTGCAFITVDASGENAITVASGANLAATAADLPSAIFRADTVLVLQMEVPFEQSLRAARLAKSAGAQIVWNLAPVPAAMSVTMLRDLLDVTGFLIVNEHEAIDAAARLGTPETSFEAAAALLAKAGRLTCVVTAGAQGAYAATADGRLLHVSAPTITPVDTTGAGDTFVGAFACMLGEQAPLQLALEVGCEAAALSCLRIGAQAAMPVRSAVTALTDRR
ncbi:ribokinase [Bradyrhizobium sp. STM 3557]|uniref:ribokinase n=1 Tax=Bradyrhizobium sp. STM 3557 TaxID=578920 RepID=UPI00388D31BB